MNVSASPTNLNIAGGNTFTLHFTLCILNGGSKPPPYNIRTVIWGGREKPGSYPD